MIPVHGYSTAAGEASSSENSLEQPSTTSGGGSGTSDGSSSCEVVPDPRRFLRGRAGPSADSYEVVPDPRPTPARSWLALGDSCEVVPDPRATSRVLSRDYSVDARTDALFHEFVKYDPNLSFRQRRLLPLNLYFSGPVQYFFE